MVARLARGKANDRLLPQGRLAGPMPWIVAIMIFLTILAAAAGIALGEGAAAMRDTVAGRLTVQVTEAEANQRDALVGRIVEAAGRVPGISRVVVVPRDELIRRIEPWLGADAASGDIPIPDLIDMDLPTDPGGAEAARRAVADAVAAITSDARVEPHAAYIGPVAALVRTVGWIAFAIVALMAVATAFVVILAARGAHAVHRGTIDIMHMLGATDGQVVRLFQRRMARDISFGAVVGLAVALAVIVLVSRSAGLLGGEMMTGIAMPWWGWIVLPVLPLLFVGVAWTAARLTLSAALERSL